MENNNTAEAYFLKTLELVENGNFDQARQFLEARPDLVQHEVNGGGWMEVAAFNGDIEMMKVLIDLGCNIDAVSDEESPLSTAIMADSPIVAKFLLMNGASISSRHRDVLTALSFENQNSIELLRLLEAHGANLNEEFENEYTGEAMNAMSKAVETKKEDVVEYLRSKGCVLPGETHQAPSNVAAEKSLEKDADIVAWFSKIFGPVKKKSLFEIVPSMPPITVHVISPNSKSECLTLFTTGVSSEKLNVPEGEDEFSFAELFIQLPTDWSWREIENPTFGWPIHWLRSVGQQPFQTDSWLGGPATIVSSEVIDEKIADTEFDSMLLLAHEEMKSDDGRLIKLYQLFPLYPEERELEIALGVPSLLEKFNAAGLSLTVDMNRKNVGTV